MAPPAFESDDQQRGVNGSNDPNAALPIDNIIKKLLDMQHQTVLHLDLVTRKVDVVKDELNRLRTEFDRAENARRSQDEQLRSQLCDALNRLSLATLRIAEHPLPPPVPPPAPFALPPGILPPHLANVFSPAALQQLLLQYPLLAQQQQQQQQQQNIRPPFNAGAPTVPVPSVPVMMPPPPVPPATVQPSVVPAFGSTSALPTASAAPTATETKDDAKPPASSASFSFGSPLNAAKTAPVPPPAPFSGFNFGNTAAQQSKPADVKPEVKENKGLGGFSFAGIGSKPILETKAKDGEGGSDDEGDGEEYEPTVDFKPVIPLPDLVEVQTGEEDEAQVFQSSRCKLYRYESTTKEWKERGVGPLSINRHKKTGKTRVVMRREQVQKLCANHYITPGLQLTVKNDKQFIWLANDAAEDEPRVEKFAIRFGTAEEAARFKKAFEDAAANGDTANESTSKQGGASKPGTTKTENAQPAKEAPKASEATKQQGFGDKFKPPAGSWTCGACYVSNSADAKLCACCQTPKPGSTEKAANATAPSTTSGFGGATLFNPTAAAATPSPFSFGIGSGSATATPKTAESAGTPSSQAAPGANKPLFGSSLAAASPLATQSTPTTGTPKFSFAAAVAKNKEEEDKTGGVKPAATAGNFAFGAAAMSAKPTGGSSFGGNAASAPGNTTAAKPALFGAGPTFSFKSAAAAADSASTNANATAGAKPTFVFKGSDNTATATAAAAASPNAGNNTTRVFGGGAASDAAPKSMMEMLSAMGNDKKTDTAAKPQTTAAQSNSSSIFSSGLFSKMSAKDDKKDGDGSEDEEEGEEYEPAGDFKPVIPLPDLIEVQTGEEDEERIFHTNRCKLYRYESTTKEWKERGAGPLSINRHKKTGKTRVVMRREQVQKLCANHYITAGLQLTVKNDKQFMWLAHDAAEDEPRMEKFAVRFTTTEDAARFKKAFEDAASSSSA